MIRKVALALGALLFAYAAYLGWRVAVERSRVSARVDAIIAAADPDERNLAPRRVAALLAVEDPTFWTNKGIDFATPGASMTTLSQSLGKRIFFDHFQPGFRKGELLAFTRFALYPKVDKNRTLRAWIARVELGTASGRRVIGLADGARTWIGKPLGQLTDREYLSLIAMLPSPRTLNPRRNPAANADRVDRIERLLAHRCRPTGVRDVSLDGCAKR